MEAKKELELLLTDIKFNNYLLNSEYILVHNDLHRSDILIDNNQINILDFENMQKYPKEGGKVVQHDTCINIQLCRIMQASTNNT